MQVRLERAVLAHQNHLLSFLPLLRLFKEFSELVSFETGRTQHLVRLRQPDVLSVAQHAVGLAVSDLVVIWSFLHIWHGFWRLVKLAARRKTLVQILFLHDDVATVGVNLGLELEFLELIQIPLQLSSLFLLLEHASVVNEHFLSSHTLRRPSKALV